MHGGRPAVGGRPGALIPPLNPALIINALRSCRHVLFVYRLNQILVKFEWGHRHGVTHSLGIH